MRKLIGLAHLFVAQLIGQAPYALANESVAPAVEVSAGRDSSTALRPPRLFSITAGRTMTTNLKQNHAGGLLLKWSPIAGAKSYVVQICSSAQCKPNRAASTKHAVGRTDGFVDLAMVTDTTYAPTKLTSGTTYQLRIVGIDAAGRRGIPSVVIAQRAL